MAHVCASAAWVLWMSHLAAAEFFSASLLVVAVSTRFQDVAALSRYSCKQSYDQLYTLLQHQPPPTSNLHRTQHKPAKQHACSQRYAS